MLSGVVEPRYRWQFPSSVAVAAGLLEAGQARGLSPRTIGLLAARGIHDASELASFFEPALAGLHDPHLLPDADLVVERLAQARARGEGVLVFGDFDADGLTGLAILVRALEACGIDAEPYVPSRLEEGHGLSLRAVDVAASAERSLIVTVDCGTTSVDEIGVAVERGIDVLVTDHHHVPATLPLARAIVNAHRADARYPDRRLTGAGVAFKVAELVVGALNEKSFDPLALADLAVIGTIADMAPIVGENRAIARLGLERIRTSARPGIAALLERAGVAAGAVDLETIAFSIAPRLNAASRVGEAGVAARLLLTDDRGEADALADALERANSTRRDMTTQALGEARQAVEGTTEPAVVVRGSWPVGIIGLVAGRLAEDRGVPAVVATGVGDVIRASCRSAGAFNLAIALDACSDLFVRYGGHPGAAGFELVPGHWEEFRQRFLALAMAAPSRDPRPTLRLDLALPAPAIDYGLFREIAQLAPFGPGNSEPLVGVLGLAVIRIRAATGGHTQLTLRRERDVLDAIAFSRDDLATLVAEGDRVDIVARLASRAFGGYESLQLEVRDIASSGTHPEAVAILAAGGPAREVAPVALAAAAIEPG